MTSLKISGIVIKSFRNGKPFRAVGVYDDEGPPVPIPNTVVKLFSAENTWRAAAREDKATPTFFMYPKLRKRTAVNCFAVLRVRSTKKQSEKRKKHRAERAKAK